MGSTQHHHHHESGLLAHPGRYELFGQVLYLGQRGRIFDRLVAASGARPGERVLDVGCGTGYLVRRVAAAVGTEGSVVGIDPSQPMLDYATRRAPANATFRAAGAEDLPFEAGSFDLVLSTLAFHHIPADRRTDAVGEMFRVLRPGGRVLIADFGPPRWPILNRLMRMIRFPAAHVRMHSNIDEATELIAARGFALTGDGDVRSLRYVTARRPAE